MLKIRDVQINAMKMIMNFINQLELDGKFYVTTLCTTPMIWGNIRDDGAFCGRNSERLQSILSEIDFTEETKEKLNETGLIVINSKFMNGLDEKELYVSAIHELIHSSRELLLYDAVRTITEREEQDGIEYRESTTNNENAYSSNGKTFEQNTIKHSSAYDFTYADASQDILKGSIDTSTNTIDKYKKLTDVDFSKIDMNDDVKGNQMSTQYYIDEALVELIARISYGLYRDRLNGIETTIQDQLVQQSKIRSKTNYDDLTKVMSQIILKHNDYELFKWMLDPMTYSSDDVHYDFFTKYTKNDKELIKEFKSIYEFEDEDKDESDIDI